MKERNSFEITVEMIDVADALFLSHYDKKLGLVCGEPYSTKSGMTWSVGMLSSIEEAVACKYPKVFDENDSELLAALEAVKKSL